MTAPANDGLLVRLLSDPGRLGRELASVLSGLLHRHAVVVGTAIAVVLVAAIALRVTRRRDERAVARQAAAIEILAPPEPDRAGAVALWANLHDLVGRRRPAPWRTRPRVAFEYVWTDQGLRIQLWLPPTVPPELARRAVEAAWPGARVR